MPDFFFNYSLPLLSGLCYSKLPMEKRVLYFSAEWGLAGRNIPIYAGGLGILAGDALLEAHRMGWPWTGMGLMYREGFFEQKIDALGAQTERHHKLQPGDHGLKLCTAVRNTHC